MASKSVSISEFSIKVTANTKAAVASLRTLNALLAAFQKQSTSSFGTFAKQLERANGSASRLNNTVSRLNNKLRDTTNKATNAGSALGGIAMGGAVIYGLAQQANALSTATAKAMAYERAIMSIKASIAGSDWGKSQVFGMAPEAKAAKLESLGEQEKRFAEQLALNNGMGLASTTSDYAKFFAAASGNLGAEGSQGLFTSFAKLSVVYGLDPEKQKRAMVAFTQMASKNQVMAEELKQQLGDVLPGSMDIFARALTKMGGHGTVTTKELFKLMEQGKIVAADLFPYVAAEMEGLADANGAYQKALLSTPMLMSKMETAYEMHNKNVYNQYSKGLGKMFILMTDLVNDKAIQVSMGSLLGNLAGEIGFLLEMVKSMVLWWGDWFDSIEDQKGTLRGLTDMLLWLTTVAGWYMAVGLLSYFRSLARATKAAAGWAGFMSLSMGGFYALALLAAIGMYTFRDALLESETFIKSFDATLDALKATMDWGQDFWDNVMPSQAQILIIDGYALSFDALRMAMNGVVEAWKIMKMMDWSILSDASIIKGTKAMGEKLSYNGSWLQRWNKSTILEEGRQWRAGGPHPSRKNRKRTAAPVLGVPPMLKRPMEADAKAAELARMKQAYQFKISQSRLSPFRNTPQNTTITSNDTYEIFVNSTQEGFQAVDDIQERAFMPRVSPAIQE